MAAKRKSKQKPKPALAEPPRIYEAMLDPGPSGLVICGAELDLEAAIVRRRASGDVVVCGENTKANARLAKKDRERGRPLPLGGTSPEGGATRLAPLSARPAPSSRTHLLRDRKPSEEGPETKMKYFTPELLSRIRSADETVAVEALEEWQRALARWQRRWQKIKGTFPEGVRRFDADNVCLHAAQVLSMGRRGDTFVMVVETEPRRQDLVILTFTLDLEPEIQDSALADKSVKDFVMWLYEEWDVDHRGRRCFEVLLSNGWVVKLHLRDFQYLIVQRVLPGPNGQLARTPAEAVPMST